MAKQTASTGTCALCGRVLARSGMSRHLKKCVSERDAQAKGKKAKVFHLFVEDRWCKEYWLHVEAKTCVPLEALDLFLRNLWLECCGHMSAFGIGRTQYTSCPLGEYDDAGMDVRMEAVLRPGLSFDHEYDFGSTTQLRLKVIAERQAVPEADIVLLARNEPPAIVCNFCGEPAVAVCSECLWDGAGWLCNKHAETHECGEDMLLPVVNSPRVGVCGYTG